LTIKHGQWELAIHFLNESIKINPHNFHAFSNIGFVYEQKNQLEESLHYYSKALNLNPSNSNLIFNIGNILLKLKNFNEALTHYDLAVKQNPLFFQAFIGRGNVFFEMHKFEDAISQYDQAIAIKPNDALAYNQKSLSLLKINLIDKAIENFNIAIELEPNNPNFLNNRLIALLRYGYLEKGFKEFERGFIINGISTRGKKRIDIKKLWLGKESLVNKTILIHYEEGFGDTLQFCRYIKLLSELGSHIIFEVQKPLFNLLKTLEGVNHLIPAGEAIPDFDFFTPLMSLPHAFKTSLATIPSTTPYISVNEDLINKWKHYLGEGGFKIAICWQGNKQHGAVDEGRSFPLSLFENISLMKGVRLISVQKFDGLDQLDTLPPSMRVEKLPQDFDSGEQAFLDTAAVLKCVDLVITSDTSITHLAGALGVKTWLALKHTPDWRWMLDRTDSPWYPHHRLFRQTSEDDWLSVFIEMESELKIQVLNKSQ